MWKLKTQYHMKKLILFICILFVLPSVLSAQNIHSTLSVKVVDAPERDTVGHLFYPYKLNVIQDFDIRTIPNDTLHLRLENVGMFQALKNPVTASYVFIPNMTVYAKKRGGKYRETDFSFDGVNLTIPKNEKTHVRVAYGYYSDLCFRIKVPLLACGLLQYDCGWNSWYFTSEKSDIRFDKVCFEVPDSAELFVNCTATTDDNGFTSLDLSKQQYKDISFYLIDKKWYDIHTFDVDDVKVRLFLSLRDSIVNEDVIPQPLSHLADTYITERKEQTRQIVTTLNRFFPDETVREVTILEEKLRTRDEKFGFGKAVHTSDDHRHAIFIDYKFWKTSDLTHELVHAYLNYNYEQIDARYFFDESLIEYFANYVFYLDEHERDKAFMNKIEYFLGLPGDQSQSIFDVTLNHVNTETGEGTNGIIYYKVPFLIHQFAKKIGEEKFVAALRALNLQAKETGSLTFDGFGKILMASGVSEKDWEQFKGSI